MVAISSLTRAFFVLPALVRAATADYYGSDPTTVVSTAYETRTVTSTICYTTTVSGDPVVYTQYYTSLEVDTVYCTDTVTATKTDVYKYTETETDVYKYTDTETDVYKYTETDIYKYTETETDIYKYTDTVTTDKWKTDYKTVTATLPRETDTVTCTETVKIPTTLYIKKYYTVTTEKNNYYTNTVTETDTVTFSTAYPVCSGVVTLYTTTLVTAPIFIPTATSYIYDIVYESYHVNTAGTTVVYTSIDNSVSVTRTTRPPQTTAYEPGFRTKQPVPATPCDTITYTSTLTYDPEIATQVQIRSTISTLVRDIPEPETLYTPTTVVLPQPTTVLPPTTTIAPPPVTYVPPPVTYVPPPVTITTSTSTYTPPPPPVSTSRSADPTITLPVATGSANKLSGGYGVFAGLAVGFLALA